MIWFRDSALALIEHFGPIALFVSLTLETLGLPFPGESVLILTSAVAATGQINIWQVAVAAWLGAVLGDNIAHFIGCRYGRDVIVVYGKRFGITESRYANVEAMASKYGPLMVMSARFVILLRQLNGLVAGSVGMHWLTFFLCNLVGAALWVGFWTILAYLFGHSVAVLPDIGRHLGTLTAILILLLVLGLIFGYLRIQRRNKIRKVQFAMEDTDGGNGMAGNGSEQTRNDGKTK